jgi:integrase
VFSTWSGKPISPNNVLRRSIFPACSALGIPNATWLTFRRTYSSWAHDKGVPGKVVAELMGHAKVDTTLNVYTQVIDESKRGRCAENRRRIVHYNSLPGSGEGAN